MKTNPMSLATLIFLISVQSNALPLLAESVAQNVANAITLYPDHADPKKFYFMPNSSKFARDSQGQMVFGFTHYGLSTNKPLNEAGAYMSFTSKLTPDDDQTRALESFLANNPGAGVSVLPVQSSTMNLQKQDGSPALVPLFSEFNFARVAGRAEDELGVNALLTGLGAKIMYSALKAPGALNVFYYYKVMGLGPTMDAKIKVNFKRVYEYFEANGSTGHLWWRVDISHVVEKLHQEGAVSWEINGGDAKDADYVQLLTEKIVQRLFVPELAATPSGSNNGGSGWSFIRVSLKNVKKEELKTETWSMKKREQVEREFGVPVNIKEINSCFNTCVIDADASFSGGRS